MAVGGCLLVRIFLRQVVRISVSLRSPSSNEVAAPGSSPSPPQVWVSHGLSLTAKAQNGITSIAQCTGHWKHHCNFFLLSKIQNNQYQIFVDKVGFDFLDVRSKFITILCLVLLELVQILHSDINDCQMRGALSSWRTRTEETFEQKWVEMFLWAASTGWQVRSCTPSSGTGMITSSTDTSQQVTFQQGLSLAN